MIDGKQKKVGTIIELIDGTSKRCTESGITIVKANDSGVTIADAFVCAAGASG
eukprot:SAG31_NODE_12616_length_929_cov_0.949398_1_plen_52_part_10